jgi:hypothetical protein
MRIMIVLVVVIGFIAGGYFIYQEYSGGSPTKPITTSPPPSPKRTFEPSIDISQVQDESVRKVLEQINEQLALISEYSCVEQTTAKVKNGELAYTEEQRFRRPDLFSGRMLQTKHVVPNVAGQVTLSVIDGKFNGWRTGIRMDGRAWSTNTI